nr:serine/arginine repetitive matrix protein 1-like [Lytechinus pictus]
MHRSRDYGHYHSSSSSDDSSYNYDRYHRWLNEREVSSSYSDSPERRNSRDVRSRRSMEDRDTSPQRSRHYRNAHCDAVSHDNGQGEKPKANRTRDYLDRSHSRRNRRDRSNSPRHDYRGDDYFSSETPLRGECDRHQYDSKGDRYESSPRRSNGPHYESPPRYRDDYYDSHYNSPPRDRDNYPSDYDHSPLRRGRRYDSPPNSYRNEYDRNESPIRRWGDDRESHSPRYRNKYRSPSPSEERRRGEEYRRDPPRESFYDSRVRGWDTRSPSPIRRSRSRYEERKDDGHSWYLLGESFSDSSRWDASSPSSIRYSERKGKGQRQSSPRRSFSDPHRRNTPSPLPVHSRVSTEHPSTSHSRVRKDKGHHGSPPRSFYDNQYDQRRETLSPSSSCPSNRNGYSRASSSSEEWAVGDCKRLTPQSPQERLRDTRSPSSAHLQCISNGYQSDVSSGVSSVATSNPNQTCQRVKSLPSVTHTSSLKQIRATPGSLEYKGPSGENKQFPPPSRAPTKQSGSIEYKGPSGEDKQFPPPSEAHTKQSEVLEKVSAHSINHRLIENRVTLLEYKMDFVLHRLKALDALESSVEYLTAKIEQLTSERSTIQEPSKGNPKGLPEAAKNQTSSMDLKKPLILEHSTPDQSVCCHGNEKPGPFEPKTLLNESVSNTSEQNQGNDLGSEERVRPRSQYVRTNPLPLFQSRQRSQLS